jgi:hypothetical protein
MLLSLFLVIFFAFSLLHLSSLKSSAKTSCLLTWAVFALGLIAKEALSSRISHYGFVLAMPAGILLVYAAFELAPSIPGALKSSGKIYKVLIAAVLLFDCFFAATLTCKYLHYKTFQISNGTDSLMGYPSTDATLTGPMISEALNEVNKRLSPGDSLVVLPQGATINYLSRRPNPTPYIVLMPPEVIMYGEDKILASLRGARPAFLLYLPVSVTDYEVGTFGEDPKWGASIMEWMEAEYETVWRGTLPEESQIRWVLLKRKT